MPMNAIQFIRHCEDEYPDFHRITYKHGESMICDIGFEQTALTEALVWDMTVDETRERIYTVLEGTLCIHTDDGRTYEIFDGRECIVPPGVPHKLMSDGAHVRIETQENHSAAA